MASTEAKEDCIIENFDEEVERLLSRGRNKTRIGKALNQAPEFTKRLNSFEEVKAGHTAIFECKFAAFPAASVKWFKDDEDITEDSRYEAQEAEAGCLQLTIATCRKADEGAYKCKIENPEGVASSTGYLSVTGNIEDKPLCSQPRKTQSEHVISAAPPLRSIREQKSLEEREAEVTAQQPPSPLQDYMRNVYKNKTWPMGMASQLQGHIKDIDNEDDDDSDSATSVDSQDSYQHLRFASDLTEDVFDEDPVIQHAVKPCHTMPNETTAPNDELNMCMPGEDVQSNGIKGPNDNSQPNGHVRLSEESSNAHSCTERETFSKSNLQLGARLRASLHDLTSISDFQLDLPMLFFLAFITGMTSYAAGTGTSPSTFVLTIACISLLSFIAFQLKQTSGK